MNARNANVQELVTEKSWRVGRAPAKQYTAGEVKAALADPALESLADGPARTLLLVLGSVVAGGYGEQLPDDAALVFVGGCVGDA